MLISIALLVVHHFQSTPEVFSNLPALMRGERVKPASGVGTNFKSSGEVKVPKAVFVGGGFSEGQTIPWLAPDPERMGEVMRAGGPWRMMDTIVGRVKKSAKEHGLVEGSEDEVKPGLWWT